MTATHLSTLLLMNLMPMGGGNHYHQMTRLCICISVKIYILNIIDGRPADLIVSKCRRPYSPVSHKWIHHHHQHVNLHPITVEYRPPLYHATSYNISGLHTTKPSFPLGWTSGTGYSFTWRNAAHTLLPSQQFSMRPRINLVEMS